MEPTPTSRLSVIGTAFKGNEVVSRMDDTQKILGAISRWKNKLLDLTRNNRALNFLKSGKSGNQTGRQVVVFQAVDQPDIFRRIVLAREKVKILPTPKEATKDLFQLAGEPNSPFTKRANPLPGEKLEIQSNIAEEKFDKFFRDTVSQAFSSIEEKGVNTLYLAFGILTFEDPKDPKKEFNAPLVLVPVMLHPNRSGSSVLLEALDEDPVVNPALVEFLKQFFQISLAELDVSEEPVESRAFEEFWESVRQTVSQRPNWKIEPGVYLSFFTFDKLVLYKDLEKNEAVISEHPVIRQIVLRSGQSVQNLPKEILDAELDRDFSPEMTAQVVDADGSQLRAILGVSKGHSIVIEGPPGTGKSQTITNLIAQALYEGKKVLFVAEKQAALNVVSSRLARVGLGEFCLDVHAEKASKAVVLKQIGDAINASTRLVPEPDTSHHLLQGVREKLTSYIRSAHQPVAPLGMKPYDAIGWLEKVRQAARVPFGLPVETVSRNAFDDTEQALREFMAVAEPIGDPRQHPWRDTRRTFYTVEDLQVIEESLIKTSNALDAVVRLSREASLLLDRPMIQHFSEVKTVVELAEVIARSPGAPGDVLRSSAWNAPPPEATDLIRLGKTVTNAGAELSRKFTPGVFEEPPDDDIAFMEGKLSATLGFLNFLNGRFRSVRRKWFGFRLAGYQKSLLDQLGDMKSVARFQKDQARLRQSEGLGRNLFGGLWKGEQSDWSRLDGYVKWVVEFRKLCVEKSMTDKAISIAEQTAPEMNVIQELKTAAARFETLLPEFAKEVEWTQPDLLGLPIEELNLRLAGFQESLSVATKWGNFERVRKQVEGGLAGEIITRAMNGEFPLSQTGQVFRRAFLFKWLKSVIQSKPELEGFATSAHEQVRKEFQGLDEATLKANRTRLIRLVRDRIQKAIQSHVNDMGWQFLIDQIGRQRKHKPLRTTFHRAFRAIQTAKPVFLMSPTTVAQFIEPSRESFDLVIFDEASQLPTEDAVGAIFRGRQLVVVGDPKQLPPTNFFSAMLGATNSEMDEDENMLFEDGESILEDIMSSGAPMSRLKWHYRSLEESLIHFSNSNFYDGELYTFPSVRTKSPEWGLSFEHVGEGLYSGKGLNLPEARRVVKAALDHARKSPHLSLGIGTFSLQQKQAIEDLLRESLKSEKELDSFFGNRDSFFVKNLESIQGDERDVIFLSTTYGRNESGVIRYNFGPLNQNNGRRRLNVLVSRSRQRMVVFSSLRADDFDLNKLETEGPRLLRGFLKYAETGTIEGLKLGTTVVFDSPFEEEVYSALSRQGLSLMTQIGDSGYKIDIGVLDPEFPGRFLCGIECDGASYHSSQTARDRDRLRQEVLEDRHWIIHRVWSTDWFRDPESQVNRLLQLIQETKEKVRNRENELPMAGTTGEHDPIEVEEFEDSEPIEADLQGLKTPYVVFRPRRNYFALDFHQSDTQLISSAILEVVEVEAPIHFKELSSRIAERWGLQSARQAVQRRIQSVLQFLQVGGKLRIDGEFIYDVDPTRTFQIRDRGAFKMSPDRIPPEEYAAAIVAVLEAKPLLDRKQLAANVRSLLGFSRTGQVLENLINSQVDDLLKVGVLAQGSTGLQLRKIEGT